MAAIVAEQRANISAAENEQADAVRRERTRKQNRVRQARKRDRDVKAKFGIDPSGNPTEKPRRSSSDGRVLALQPACSLGRATSTTSRSSTARAKKTMPAIRASDAKYLNSIVCPLLVRSIAVPDRKPVATCGVQKLGPACVSPVFGALTEFTHPKAPG